jgi:hypothetical protein
MWALLDSGRRGGYDVAARPNRRHKSRGRGKGRTDPDSSRGRGMKIGGQWAAGPVTVKRRTSGRGTWAKGRDKGYAAGLEAARDELRRAVNDG